MERETMSDSQIDLLCRHCGATWSEDREAFLRRLESGVLHDCNVVVA